MANIDIASPGSDEDALRYAFDALLGGSNIPTLSLPRLRAALAATREGTANTKILVMGDSTSYGTYPVSSTTRANGWPVKAAQRLLATTGMTGGWQNFFGSSYPGLDPTVADPRIVLSGGMALAGSVGSLGGYAFKATASGTLAFTPTVEVDTFDIYYIAAFGMTFNRNIDGGSDTLVTPPVTNNSIQKATVTTTLGSHTLNIKWNAGTIYVVGVDSYNSAVKQVSFWNASWFGSASTNWISNTNPYDVLPTAVSVAPHAAFIMIGINDWDGATTVATFTTRLQSIIDALSPTIDLILMTPVPTANVASLSRQGEFVQAIRSLAQTNGRPLVDLWRDWGEDQDVMEAVSFYYDTVHPNNAGQADTAARINRFISNL